MENFVCSASIVDIGDVICKVGSLLKSIIPVLMTIGVIYFVWGIVGYVIGDDEEAKKRGKNKIIYGIIGFAVIMGMWGLVNIVITTFGFDGGTQIVSDFITKNNDALAPDSAGCTLGTNPQLGTLFNYATCLINSSIIPLIFSLAVLMFIWGVVQYVINSDEEAKKAKGKEL
jgi:hypothetical protein